MFTSLLKKFFGVGKIDLDKLRCESDLDSLFLRFGSDKGFLDGKKTFFYENRNKKNNTNNVFIDYKTWVQRKNLKDFNYQLGLNFSPIYEKYFSKYKNSNLKILEIGVANGHSIASFYKYFSNSNIFGIDIKSEDKIFYKGSRLKYFSINLFDEKKIKKFIKKFSPFDLIIDDSLHNDKAMLQNFINFYSSLSSGGYYILEDFKYDDYYKKLELQYNEKKQKLTIIKLEIGTKQKK